MTTSTRSSGQRRSADELRRSLAADLLAIEPGMKLPTMRQFARQLGASLGAVQQALAAMEAEGAFTVDRRGRLGTMLLTRAVGALWSAAEAVPLILSMPLPTTAEIEGLATATKALFNEAGVEAYLVFSRGSRPRLAELWQQRCHVAVMSALAAHELCGRSETILIELPAPSYVREHRVYYVEGAYLEGVVEGWQSPLRVAIDRDSLDFQRLSELEFAGTEAVFIGAPYMDCQRLLSEGVADAVVWDAAEAEKRMPASIRHRQLSSHVIETIGDSDLRTAFVTRAQDDSVQRVAKACLNPRALMRIYNQVLEGTRTPAY